MDDGIQLSEDKYLLSSLIKACSYVNSAVKMRLPIQKDLMNLIVTNINNSYGSINQPYLAVLYTTMISTAYYGMFRVGEISAETHPVLARDVKISDNKKKMKFILRTS